jgi:thymidylate kinase
MSTGTAEIATFKVPDATALPFPRQRAMLICLSGPGGTGKTRIAQRLESDFRRQGIQAQYQWLCGGSSTIVEILVRLAARLPFRRRRPAGRLRRGIKRVCWQMLVGADLVRFCLFKVRVPLLLGKVVICDRYTFDTFSDVASEYESEPRSDSMNGFETLFHFLYPRPDLHYLLLAEPAEMERWEGASHPLRSEDRAAKLQLYLKRYQPSAHFLIRRVDGDFDRLEREISREAQKYYWQKFQINGTD